MVSNKKNFVIFFFAAFIFLLSTVFVAIFHFQQIIYRVSSTDYKYGAAAMASALNDAGAQKPSLPLENPPVILKSIYMTGWSAGSKNYLSYLQDIIKTTEINSVVIDVKDYSGVVSYNTEAVLAKKYHAYYPQISDINALIKMLHDEHVYVIGRVVVFEDPMLAKNRPDLAIYDTSKTQDISKPVLWEGNDHLAWVDPASKEVWDYNIQIAKDALSHGFDEINFDYVRFPTGKDAQAMGFPVWDGKTPKHVVIKSFFQKLRESFPDANISADIFGQTTTNTDDMGIGQILEEALSYFNGVYPMVYPSHYISGFAGFTKPAEHPYEIVAYALDSAAARKKVLQKVNESLAVDATDSPVQKPTALASIRPWLQDFNLGATYDAAMVAQEIKAVVDAMGSDFSGYLLWSPSNVYHKSAMANNSLAPNTKIP